MPSPKILCEMFKHFLQMCSMQKKFFWFPNRLSESQKNLSRKQMRVLRKQMRVLMKM